MKIIQIETQQTDKDSNLKIRLKNEFGTIRLELSPDLKEELRKQLNHIEEKAPFPYYENKQIAINTKHGT